MTKPVVVTPLSIRFYAIDGWSEELLRQYVKKGALLRKGRLHSTADPVYWIVEFGSVLDLDKLFYDNHVGELIDKDRFSEFNGLPDKEIMKRRT